VFVLFCITYRQSNLVYSADKLRHLSSDAYSAEQALLNKQRVVCSLLGTTGIHRVHDCKQPPYNY